MGFLEHPMALVTIGIYIGFFIGIFTVGIFRKEFYED